MIRLRELTLIDAKNTRQGTLRFRDLPSGASVTGIYGQNGSGKTTVIIAIQLLKTLMEGASISQQSIGFIRQGAHHSEIHALFDHNEDTILYKVTLERTSDNTGQARVAGESLTIRPHDGRKRVLIDHELNATADDMGLRTFHTLPHVQWRSIRSVRSGDELLAQEETLAWSESRSFLFAKNTSDILHRIKTLVEQDKHVSASKTNAYENNLTPLLATVETLAAFAQNDMRIITTREGSSVSFDFARLPYEGKGQQLLNIGSKAILRADYQPAVENMVRQANKVMPTLVPGLQLSYEINPTTLKNGDPAIEVFLYSIRNNVTIPLWAESEGIRRIIGILSLLIRMFNEENVCVAIDEIDSGVFETLLGSLLEVLATRGVGQLIFTAHNLRVLETLTSESIIFSTTKTDERFTTISTRGTNNLRDMYIGIVERGTSDKPLSDRTRRYEIALALTEAEMESGAL